MSYFVEKNILNEDDIDLLVDYANAIELKYFDRQSRLLNVEQYHVLQHDRPISDFHLRVISKIQKTAESLYNIDLKANKAYYLLYKEGASAESHFDDVDMSYVTCVVPIQLSDDLEGGETFVESSTKEQLVLPLELGDNLFYGDQQRHGVTEVTKGSRLVFVVWFAKQD